MFLEIDLQSIRLKLYGIHHHHQHHHSCHHHHHCHQHHHHHHHQSLTGECDRRAHSQWCIALLGLAATHLMMMMMMILLMMMMTMVFFDDDDDDEKRVETIRLKKEKYLAMLGD